MYSHRNGETEPPTVAGYYWFKGNRRVPDDDGQMTDELRESIGVARVHLLEPFALMDTLNQSDLYMWHSQGQWWGPVTPPWDAQPPAQPTMPSDVRATIIDCLGEVREMLLREHAHDSGYGVPAIDAAFAWLDANSPQERTE